MSEATQQPMTERHLMVDIEDLSTKSNAVVTQIAAVFFDPITGEKFEKFCVELGADEQTLKGRHICEDTLQWYKENKIPMLGWSEQARPVEAALEWFCAWVMERLGDKDSLQVWCKGPDHDFAILEDLFKMYEAELPWFFWNQRDVRTAVAMAKDAGVNVPKYDATHDALEDCIHQVDHLCAALMGLGKLLQLTEVESHPEEGVAC